MTNKMMLSAFNKNFRPGQRVRVEIPQVLFGRTLTEAKECDGEAKVFADCCVGPIPLKFVRPIGDSEFEL